MPESLKKLRIFAASPSDVASERAKLETVVDSLKPIADYLGLTLEVIDWRAVVPDAGRPQQIIFDQLEPTSWDIFVGILWHRFGTPPGGKDPQTQKDYLSGTEEEFRTAYRLQKQFEKPRIVLYRCSRPIPQEADLIQAQSVKDFFKEIQDPSSEFRVLTQSFDTVESFEKLALDNLQRLLIEYSDQTKTPITLETVQTLTPTIPNNLPRRQAFFGRSKEMETVTRALSPADRTWGVLVDGIGGIGKSAIAVEVAYRVQEAGTFDAFVFVTAKQNILEPSGIRELTPPARTLDEFLNETARILGQSGIAKLAGDEKRRALLDVLRTMHTLIIYDNLETLSKEEQEGIADFLRELPQGCKAIITSRRRGGEGAMWLRVEALDWDAARGIIENEIARSKELTNKLRLEESRWQDLYDETNGSPLALVHTLGLMRVRAALTFDGALAMLRGNRDADLQKFIFQEARKELTTNDKTALGALSFFSPSATFETWMQAANLSRNRLETTIDRLSALSLVDVFAGEERYALHPLTRAFVRDELLADANVAGEAGTRFVQYWVDYANRYGGQGKDSYKTYQRLENEWGNLLVAVNWLQRRVTVANNIIQDKKVLQSATELIVAISNFLWFRGHWDEEVQFNTWLYEAMLITKNWNVAINSADRVLDVYDNRGQTDEYNLWVHKYNEIIRHQNVGKKDTEPIDYVQDRQKIRASLLKSKQFLSFIVESIDLGKYAASQGNYTLAEQCYSEALKVAQKIDDKEKQAILNCMVGEIAMLKEQLTNALHWFSEGLKVALEVQSVILVAQAEYGLACVHKAEGNMDLALPLAQEALKIYERLRHKDLGKVREFVEELQEADG